MSSTRVHWEVCPDKYARVISAAERPPLGTIESVTYLSIQVHPYDSLRSLGAPHPQHQTAMKPKPKT